MTAEFAADGRALALPMTGIGRYAFETLSRLPGDWTALCKPGAEIAHGQASVQVLGPRSKDVIWNELAFAPAADSFRSTWGAFGLAPWRKISRGRLVVTIYDTLEWDSVDMPRGLATTRKIGHAAAARRADVIVAISESTASSFLRRYGRRADLIAAPAPTAPTPDSETLERVRHQLESHGAPAGTRFALSVGAPIPRKNVLRSVEAAASIPGLRVVLVGGQADKRTEHVLNQYASAGSLLRWGRATQEELGALYLLSDVLLFTPLAEGFGMPLLDARALGLRIVTSDEEPMRSAGGPSALLCNPSDVAAIRRALVSSLDVPRPFPEALPGWGSTAATTWSALTD